MLIGVKYEIRDENLRYRIVNGSVIYSVLEEKNYILE